MKKAIFLFALLLIAACSSDDDNADGNNTNTADFIDSDGDGVSTEVEQNDGTNPNDACSFLLSSQDYSKTTAAWRNEDCDGDGVSNGLEMDPDGNEHYDGNGTDPLDECSLDQNLQNLEPSSDWLAMDCDGDCKSNSEELNDNTNLLDGDDFVGNGQFISQILEYDFDDEVFARYQFDENGSRIMSILNGNDIVTYEYIYENGNVKEIHTFNDQGFSVTTIIFEYSNDQITNFSKDYAGNFDEYTVNYEGNYILVYDGSEPPGLFLRRIEFDTAMQNIIRSEWYRNSNSNYIYRNTTYTYDGFGNRTSYTSEEMGYDPSTGEYYPLTGNNITGKTFEYSNEVINPTYEAYKKLEVSAFLSNYGLKSPIPSPTSPYFCSYYLYNLGYDQFEHNYEIDCVQSNQTPIEITHINNYGSTLLKKFIYE